MCQRFGGTYCLHHQAGVGWEADNMFLRNTRTQPKCYTGPTILKTTLTLPSPWTPQILHYSTHNYIRFSVLIRHGHAWMSAGVYMLRWIRASQKSDWLQTGRPRFDSRQQQQSSSPPCPERFLRTTQPLIQWVPGTVSPEVNPPKRDDGY
jgi:hypothetical protein